MHQVNTNIIPASLDDKDAPTWYASRSMEYQPRSIRFPQALWDRIDRDAERCKRSAVKHLEALLETYYRLSESIELNSEAMEESRRRMGSEEMDALIRHGVQGKLNPVTKTPKGSLSDETKTQTKTPLRKVK